MCVSKYIWRESELLFSYNVVARRERQKMSTSLRGGFMKI